VKALAEQFPDSVHVKDLGMEQTDDRLIWEYAKQNGFIIISKDTDFYQRSLLFGHPPKLIWFRRGNCPTKRVELILRNQLDRIEQFGNDDQAGCLILF
jgi:predicted nuclease of predicted toxin-antitoxin system